MALHRGAHVGTAMSSCHQAGHGYMTLVNLSAWLPVVKKRSPGRRGGSAAVLAAQVAHWPSSKRTSRACR
jgi:hypothetical protein